MRRSTFVNTAGGAFVSPSVSFWLRSLDRQLIELFRRMTCLLVDADDCLLVRPGDQTEGPTSLGIKPGVVIADPLFALDLKIAPVSILELLLAPPTNPS